MKRVFLWLIFVLAFHKLLAEKIGDIASVVGVRDNQLIGYGLVIGLNGTGDKSGSKFTMQSISNMLESVNVKISADDIKSKNVAAVMITASLPPFARQGDKIDIHISSIGDAKSIQGGTLVMTPLNAVDGNIYALAQGAIVSGNSNNLLSANIINGATIEREVSYDLFHKNAMVLSLKSPNFKNAIQVQNTLNKVFGNKVAIALDPKTIQITRPERLSMVEFLALVQEIPINYSAKNKIIVDEKSGTIVSGVDIIVHPIVVTSQDITLKITKEPLNDSKNTQDLDNNMSLDTAHNTLSSNGKSITIAGVVKALQKIGVSAKGMVSILQALKKSGAISAEMEIL
ncbi:flagellar basal body P-ring protein FlgI [Helicobacter pylori]|uniref:flagellar basal body P-ring protein FlgI n=1 Tax=Helicobacter pylori TaxID=210 RepID=UPI0002594A30|nr:flagellar basal body P-ring protein FlgI [Helicobacter pylori]AFI06954.1 flagellar basal body P-ring protein [Helicobacter pylori HUP-B14]KAA6501750.1 flagellar basal body P-ring protein FlgI [Helicobacter pylori]KAA6505056.1 flagellar basal body P-ring protein FlgI [Helicobacter pylori]KAA6517515.1 flagellar basal body P-ring protein FlgI [Helicobacter pylori]MCQ2860844.1 flagellar basal body P-ring protein FlgI [Helicobacter pylori]